MVPRIECAPCGYGLPDYVVETFIIRLSARLVGLFKFHFSVRDGFGVVRKCTDERPPPLPAVRVGAGRRPVKVQRQSSQP